MRAVITREFGGPEVLEIAEVPVPEPAEGQVLVKVGAATVNPVDLATRSGALAALLGEVDQVGLGWDVAGTVHAAGPGAGFAVGDTVIGLRDRPATPLGAQADHVLLDASAVAATALPTVAAATLPLNGLTAAQALDLFEFEPGSTLLVTGAAGAVGGFAVELAARRAIRVVAQADPRDEEFVRGLGAEWFVPRGGDLAGAVRALVPGGVDGVLDTAVLGAPALGAVRSGGVLVAVRIGAEPLAERGIRVATVRVHADGPRLAELSALAERGELTLRVAHTLPLHEVRHAHELLAKGGLRGRVVLVP
ncbi:NADP-dependent oxidoreductase [Kutzneria albida]|uniref:NADPH:quinone reductase and related Zn-dependentoxidoreductase n=1 Tax=Kutzneria albida DSM 43870 TaxID=1449976 RepID=W5VY68_9PSEU|nr:NADP-dependent oxidoreductase [Kutzneria albida]AHH93823.1 NADPH:quinone reductase and related Zn-dependentoxidoreductase [Kutzneria albida DSM 43870]